MKGSEFAIGHIGFLQYTSGGDKQAIMLFESMQNRVAVVTGAGGLIGRAIARTLAVAGMRVVVSDINTAAGRQTVQLVQEKSGGQAIYHPADISDPAQVEGLIQTTITRFGRLDVFVNNAMVHIPKSVLEMSVEEWDSVQNVCLRAAFLSAKYAIPVMQRQTPKGGNFINVSSVHALAAYPANPAYDAAKAGLLALTRQIAADYGRDGIRANAILPGLIIAPPDEEPPPAWLNPDTINLYPTGRVGYPADVANAVLYLASDAAQFITGTTLVIDGGMLARSPEYKIQQSESETTD
jgi:NAD(P)-dependent dehydrogenase (short-subunit alcohol dehydrogenase family)